jgi:hypothetical protein
MSDLRNEAKIHAKIQREISTSTLVTAGSIDYMEYGIWNLSISIIFLDQSNPLTRLN